MQTYLSPMVTMNVTMNTTKPSLPMGLEPYQSGSFTNMMSGCKGG